MKKFLEELKNASMNTYDIEPSSSKAKETLDSVRSRFVHLRGKKAIHTSKTMKESRVVTIKEVGPRFITVEYPYYGDVTGTVTTTIIYNALLSGDDTLEVE